MSIGSAPYEAWPSADRDIFDDLFRLGDPLTGRGPLSHYRQPSVANLRIGYGRWIGWLTAVNPDALHETAVARATGARVRNWIAGHANLSPETRLSMLDRAMRVLQTHQKDADWSEHRRLAALLRRECRDYVSDRKIGRVVSSSLLLRAGLSYAEGKQVSDSRSTKLMRAQAYRDGIMVAFLALLPLRRRCFLALELGRSGVVHGSGVTIMLWSGMTKNGCSFDCPLPAIISDPLRDYIARVWPWFLERGAQDSRSLWVGDRGRPYHAVHFSQRITRITEKLVGVRVSPHLFRDCAATTLALESPDAAVAAT